LDCVRDAAPWPFGRSPVSSAWFGLSWTSSNTTPGLAERNTRKGHLCVWGAGTTLPSTSPRVTGSGRTRGRAASTAAQRCGSIRVSGSRVPCFSNTQVWAVRREVESAIPYGFVHRLLVRASCKRFRAPWLGLVVVFSVSCRKILLLQV
jgi:hypothetical protein